MSLKYLSRDSPMWDAVIDAVTRDDDIELFQELQAADEIPPEYFGQNETLRAALIGCYKLLLVASVTAQRFLQQTLQELPVPWRAPLALIALLAALAYVFWDEVRAYRSKTKLFIALSAYLAWTLVAT